VSARWLVGRYVEPNAAPWLGRWLAMSGRLELNEWNRLKGTTVAGDPTLRAFELPGEPLWVAAGTRVGESIGVDVWDYWNVPVAALLIVSIAAVALACCGPTVALITGLVAALDPVTLLHASNRDDAVLGSALLWAVFALIALRWRDAPRRHVANDVALFAAAGAAAITRTEAVLMILPLLALKPIRRSAVVAVAGVVVALTAWGVRNQMVLGHFLIGSTHDGITLWESNGPFAMRSLSLGQVDIVSMNQTVMAPIFAATRPLDEIGADQYFKAQAIRYMTSHPIQVAKTAVAKIAISIASVHPDVSLTAPRNLAAMLDNAVLLVLAALGLSRFPAKTALAGMCLITLALLAFGPAGMRYWLTLRGALWILAALTVMRLAQSLARGSASGIPVQPSST
jgi:hypothetical protein